MVAAAMANTTLDERSPNMIQQKIKKYANGIVYIVDDVDEDSVNARVKGMQGRGKNSKKRMRMTEHEENCIAIPDFFTDYSNYKIKGVILPDDATVGEFMAYWKHEIANWSEDTFIIVYYHGDAGNAENKYHWDMESDPGRINAFKLIELINTGPADVMLLLDCFIQDLFTQKWARTQGQTEIIARPQRMQKKDGYVLKHDKDFTTAMIDNLTQYVDEIHDKKRRALRSVLQIMGEDKGMYSSPKRIGLNQTRPPYKEVIRRFKLDPYLVALEEKIEFFGEQIQGPPEKEEKFVEEGLFVPEDEGLGFEGFDEL